MFRADISPHMKLMQGG